MFIESFFDDVNSWEKYRDCLRKDSRIDESLRTKLIDASRPFELHFGNEFLKNCHEWKIRHPLFTNHLANVGTDAAQEIIELAQVLTALSTKERFRRVLTDLKSDALFYKAKLELHHAYNFIKKGFDVDIDFLVMLNHREKRPDIRFEFENTLGYIEVTELDQSSLGRRLDESMSRLIRALQTKNVHFAAQFLRPISAAHLEEQLPTLIHEIDSLSEGKPFAALQIPGYLELAIATERTNSQLIEWCSHCNLQPGAISGPIMPSEVERINTAIRAKQSQLPNDSVGAIIIKNNRFDASRGALSELVYNIQETVFGYKHLLYVLVYSQFLADQTAPYHEEFERHERYIYPQYHYMRHCLLFFNRFNVHNIDGQHLDKIRAALLNLQ